jgi:hypothetical protein
MSTAIGNNLSLLNYTRTGSTLADAPMSLATILNEGSDDGGSQLPSSTNVALSNEAKAYLARTTATPETAASAATRAADARQWFDQQYDTLGISSALLDGKVAVDLTGQSRATLSAVAANASGLFSKDESTAASTVLQSRFEAAISPHVAIARHAGDYAALYEAALKYADAAGPDEKATTGWQDQKQALVDGLAAAKKTFGKAPDTDNPSDPVAALLAKPAAGGPASPATDIASIARNARAMLDDQADSAGDKGLELTFDASRKGGQQVDFVKLDNRALAAIALNQGSAFSGEEVRAAKSALEGRHRSDIMDVMKSAGGGADGYQGLITQYGAMSAEEKSVLGISGSYSDRLVQSYRSAMSTQNALGGGNVSLGLSSYL